MKNLLNKIGVRINPLDGTKLYERQLMAFVYLISSIISFISIGFIRVDWDIRVWKFIINRKFLRDKNRGH